MTPTPNEAKPQTTEPLDWKALHMEVSRALAVQSHLLGKIDAAVGYAGVDVEPEKTLARVKEKIATLEARLAEVTKEWHAATEREAARFHVEKELLARLAEVERDRDEWRTQHENAVACWYGERDQLAARLAAVEKERDTIARAHQGTKAELMLTTGRLAEAERRAKALESRLRLTRDDIAARLGDHVWTTTEHDTRQAAVLRSMIAAIDAVLPDAALAPAAINSSQADSSSRVAGAKEEETMRISDFADFCEAHGRDVEHALKQARTEAIESAAKAVVRSRCGLNMGQIETLSNDIRALAAPKATEAKPCRKHEEGTAAAPCTCPPCPHGLGGDFARNCARCIDENFEAFESKRKAMPPQPMKPLQHERDCHLFGCICWPGAIVNDRPNPAAEEGKATCDAQAIDGERCVLPVGHDDVHIDARGAPWHPPPKPDAGEARGDAVTRTEVGGGVLFSGSLGEAHAEIERLKAKLAKAQRLNIDTAKAEAELIQEAARYREALEAEEAFARESAAENERDPEGLGGGYFMGTPKLMDLRARADELRRAALETKGFV